MGGYSYGRVVLVLRRGAQGGLGGLEWMDASVGGWVGGRLFSLML